MPHPPSIVIGDYVLTHRDGLLRIGIRPQILIRDLAIGIALCLPFLGTAMRSDIP